MNNYKAIIFDLDGTLADSLFDIADSMNKVLTKKNYPTFSYEEYKYLVGNGLKNLVYYSIPEKERNEENVSSCLAMMMDEYNSHYVDKTTLYKGIPELLDYLNSLEIKMSVLSNKADELTQKICKELLNKWNFEIIMGASDQFPRKPDPQSALYIADYLKVNPENTLYLGDTNVDMKTANAAKMYAIGATWGFRTRKELEENNAKMIIDEPMELVEKLAYKILLIPNNE